LISSEVVDRCLNEHTVSENGELILFSSFRVLQFGEVGISTFLKKRILASYFHQSRPRHLRHEATKARAGRDPSLTPTDRTD
jgi:hypothetical protein